MNLKEEILARTNRGLEVFCFYMPIDFVPKRNFRNPLYDDRRASCNIYLDAKTQCYRMKDFGNDMYSGDCFWFAATILGLDVKTDFRKVLECIIEDLHLNISDDSSERKRYLPRPSPPVIKPKRPITSTEHLKRFKLYEQAFTNEELKFWMRYGINNKTLERFHVRSLARYESISSQGKPYFLQSSLEEPMFAYILGDFVKLYRPKSKVRFLYGGEKTEDYIFGFE